MVASRTTASARPGAATKMVACLLAFAVVLFSSCRVACSRSLTSLSSHGAHAQWEGGQAAHPVLESPTAAVDQPSQLGVGDDGAGKPLAKNSDPLIMKKKSHKKAPPKPKHHGHHAPPADLSPPAPDSYGGQPPVAPAPKPDMAPWPFPWPQPRPGYQSPPLPAWPHPGNDWPPLPPFPFQPPPLPAWPQPEPGKQWPPLPAWPQPEPGKQWPPFPEWPQPEPVNNQWPPLPPFPAWPQPEPGNNQWPPLPPFPSHPPPMPSWKWPPAASFHGEEERRASSLPPPVPARN